MSVIPFPSISIETLEDENLTRASELLHARWHKTYGRHLPKELIEQHDLDYFSDYLKDKQPRTWLAWYNDNLAGVMTLNLNCIDELAVIPELRRRSIGHRLLGIAIQDCKARDYQSMQVGIEAFNQGAIEFFESQGWRQVGSEFLPISGVEQVKAMVFSRRCQQM